MSVHDLDSGVLKELGNNVAGVLLRLESSSTSELNGGAVAKVKEAKILLRCSQDALEAAARLQQLAETGPA